MDKIEFNSNSTEICTALAENLLYWQVEHSSGEVVIAPATSSTVRGKFFVEVQLEADTHHGRSRKGPNFLKLRVSTIKLH